MVREDQRDAIADRLHIVAELIREHGRAYDYRVHTNQELTGFLAKLGAEEPNSTAAPPDFPQFTDDPPLPPPPPVLLPICLEKRGGC